MEQNKPQCNMREAIVASLYDEATPEEAARLKSHVAECSTCSRELSEFERVRALMRHWQLDDVPVFRFAPQPRRRALEVLKELLGVMPVWVKSLGAVAALLVVLAVLGAELQIGPGGFSFRASLFRTAQPVQQPDAEPLSEARIKALVDEMIAASAQEQTSELQAALQSLESAVQGAHSSELARLAARIKDHRSRIDSLERDIDRREGLDLAGLLLSGATLERRESPDGAE